MRNPGLKTVAGVILSCCILLVIFQSCKEDKKEKEMEETVEKKENVIQVLTEVMDFQVQDTVQSGWQTFRYKNASSEAHFILLDKYPEGKNIKDGEKDVMPIFQEGMDLINKGEMDAAMEAFGKLPPWFSEIVFSGGVGLVSPGKVAESTVYLEPGYYVLECYVKMPNGVFHGVMGMAKEMVVIADSTANTAPESTVKIALSGAEGISVLDSIHAGPQVFEVKFEDQMTHENFVGHDVNLVRLSENANLDELEKWMNWADPEGLISPAPEGIIFLGGINDLPAGKTGYFKADLDSGKYALISEVPNTREKNMLITFTIP
ncbi:hypothetical protein [Zeaxanthinibacter enoshimensis]|uniref:Uncharacterized protein n=1 Tax=Zeaxanthinibacter enoshimensis TaxID=392009 RepID=A0A4R6TR25_9FLAO|nr:hypothetical protein [Zeaxanthinibacter enoshimensis]TDQ30950.1 hypothetical protein CLV82_1648 [Zeaxanthinibacter enoshimensis]